MPSSFVSTRSLFDSKYGVKTRPGRGKRYVAKLNIGKLLPAAARTAALGENGKN
jgi:hypothetical protein